MGLGAFIGCLVVLFIGIGIAVFAWWAGSTTGSDVYNGLNCSEYNYDRSVRQEQQCSAATGGMIVGVISGIISMIFLIVGFIGSIIFGIKLAVDNRKKIVKQLN